MSVGVGRGPTGDGRAAMGWRAVHGVGGATGPSGLGREPRGARAVGSCEVFASAAAAWRILRPRREKTGTFFNSRYFAASREDCSLGTSEPRLSHL